MAKLTKRQAAKQPPAEIKALGQGAVAQILKIFGRNPPDTGVEETLKSYSKMPWLRAINDKIGGALASLRWRAYVKVENGEKGQRRVTNDPGLANLGWEVRGKEIRNLVDTGQLVELPAHPIVDAIYNEGDNFTGVTLRELTQKYLDLVGEAFWIKVRNQDGMPVEFLPVPPHWVDDTPSTEEPFFKLNIPNSTIARYPEKVYPEDMIWFYHPNPYNPYLRGVGMGHTLADELETDEYAAKFLKTFFFNQARPDYLISSENLEKEDTERLERRWLDKLRGMYRGFSPFFSNRKLDVTRLTADYGHLQMLDLRTHERDVCLQVYGAQPEIFGITEASNRATSEVAEYLFSRWVIVPRAEFLRAVLQQKLVPDYDRRIILHFDSPIMKDKEHILKVATIAPWCLELDEWREMMDLMPLSDGRGRDVFCKPLNYEFFSIEDAKNPPPPEENEPPENETPPESDQDEDEEMEETPDEEMEESILDEFFAFLEESRGIAWVKVEDLAEHLEAGDYDAVIQDCSECFGEYEGLAIAIQKAIIKQGMKTADSVGRWLPNDAKLEAYTREMHMYVKDGITLMNEFHDSAILGVEDAAPQLMKQMTPRKVAEMIAGNLGISEDQWNDVLAEDPGDYETVLEQKQEELLREFPVRLVNDALSFAQLQIAKEAMKNGYLSKQHIKRVWKTHELDEIYDECKAMNEQHVAGTDFWELETGGTVVLPTRSHPDCHCREQLVINGGEA